MKDLKLTVTINKPASEIFNFVTNPNNTPVWINSIVKEEVSSDTISVGTTYRNWDVSENMNEYVVAQYVPNKLFQLDATHQDYKLRYTCIPLSDTSTQFEYYEWSESGQLHATDMDAILAKLKQIMETS